MKRKYFDFHRCTAIISLWICIITVGNVSAQTTSMETISIDSISASSSSSSSFSNNSNISHKGIIYVAKGTVITNGEIFNGKIVNLEAIHDNNSTKISKKSTKRILQNKQSASEIKQIVIANESMVLYNVSQKNSKDSFTSSTSSQENALSQIPIGKIKSILSYNLYYFNRYATRMYYTKTLLYSTDSHSSVFRARPPPKFYLS